VSRLKRLIRAIDPRALERNANGLDSLRASIKALRHDLRSVREALTQLMTQLGAVQVQVDQLSTLRREEMDAPARMDRLERILDTDRICAHMRHAVARAEIVYDPVPHAVIAGFLPSDAYDAAIDAIPSPVFFEGSGASGQTLQIPPRLAPTYSIVTWTFLTDVFNDALVPLLVERFPHQLDASIRMPSPSLATSSVPRIGPMATHARIVLRQPGRDAPHGRTHPSDLVTVVIQLARRGDGEDYGSRLRREAVLEDIPFRANSAVVVLNRTGAHEYASIPPTAPTGTVRYTYEFRVRVSRQN
jgi:hypothetical protein